ncbi:MAG: hypothetical protein A2043_04025 [Candidatus Schekmanbacteria bacterium GWA2_38_9]|uniref:Uncharacterized protein n=1 Tax=Candidatus Schekmanbacteria bacterium RIFCSPLOWO2_12_FULL_38_15 TaxID=1817883 RepID=A0A1F7SI03_9BACT|nr:MAG: hypothetical protein A2043_04025 [Candidatus Schekmanbacteria bacterium GWA2_38_9]OGL50817.1 MAG: hypothetical protein A3H37_03125 [Candidatus Schekmanbacteria bacterium RIFCSPLOWO2_02_FULL_38_14]OGL53422.1 MAG: hypothetical protein A3G31_07940 [Candidatus Schekmanbacteria bacterium RIFCSPLOWO2_12_FULL_38_15]
MQLNVKNYKLKLIQPSQLVNGKIRKFEKSFVPSRTLPYIAALTPSDFSVSIIDETLEDINFDEPVDLVGITSLITQLPRALQIAEEYKKRGTKVILGGPAPSYLIEEVLPHVDSVVVGESENIWWKVLDDFKKGELEKIYFPNGTPSLEKLPTPCFNLLPLDKYLKPGFLFKTSKWPRIPIETARGCFHDCDFCCVSNYFGKKMRFRPIAEVVEEIQKFKGAFIVFTDDNIAAQPERAKELFKALISLKIHWFGQFSSLAAMDEELVTLAGKSGCIFAFLGIESISKESLLSVRKNFNRIENYSKIFKIYSDAGIQPNPSMIFGFDGDTKELMDETIDFLTKEKIPLMVQWILTPVPGTKLFERFLEEGRILHKDYSKYDGTNVVFKPKNMEPNELEEKFWEVFQKFYRISNIAYRLFYRLNKLTIFLLKRNLFFQNMVNRRIHPYSGGLE